MEDIPNFREGQRIINETAHAARLAIQKHRNTVRYEGVHPTLAVTTSPTNEGASGAPDPIEQLKQLAQLRDAGVVTEEEFQAKKTEILSRL